MQCFFFVSVLYRTKQFNMMYRKKITLDLVSFNCNLCTNKVVKIIVYIILIIKTIFILNDEIHKENMNSYFCCLVLNAII